MEVLAWTLLTAIAASVPRRLVEITAAPVRYKIKTN